jgi:hypothetical protein
MAADFSKIFAQNGPVSPPTDEEYLQGFEFLNGLPPSLELFNFLFKNIDIKAKENAETIGGFLDGTSTAIIKSVFAGTRTGLTGIARYHAAEEITAHAHYGFLDDSIVDYSEISPTQAHASFNDNARIQGVQNSNHHHSFQAYPHYDNTGTLGRMSGFWMQPDVVAGTITELSEFKAANPLGTGVITNLYGLYVDSLTRGVSNYAIYTAGTTPVRFGGPIMLAGQATIEYEETSGDIHITPRSGYNVHFRTAGNSIYIGGGSTNNSAFAAKLTNSLGGNFEITPRSGYKTVLTAGTLNIAAISTYASNAAAITGGLVAGDFYMTSTGQLMIVY